jgi:hypothetical protein
MLLSMAVAPSFLQRWLPLAFICGLVTGPVLAAAPGPANTAPKATAQHSRLATCQAECDRSATSDDGRSVCKMTCLKKEGLRAKMAPVVRKPVTVHPSAVPPAGTPATTPGPSVAPATPAPNAYASCRAECANGPADNIATCQLNCESARKHEANKAAAGTQTGGTATSRPVSSAPAAAPTTTTTTTPRTSAGQVQVTTTSSSSNSRTPAQIASCKQSCDNKPGISDTDRATCKLGCESSGAKSSSFTVTGTPAQIRCYKACACQSDCAKTQARCERSCDTMGDSGARASCKLQCESSASSCPKRCPAKAADCQCN